MRTIDRWNGQPESLFGERLGTIVLHFRKLPTQVQTGIGTVQEDTVTVVDELAAGCGVGEIGLVGGLSNTRQPNEIVPKGEFEILSNRSITDQSQLGEARYGRRRCLGIAQNNRIVEIAHEGVLIVGIAEKPKLGFRCQTEPIPIPTATHTELSAVELIVGMDLVIALVSVRVKGGDCEVLENAEVSEACQPFVSAKGGPQIGFDVLDGRAIRHIHSIRGKKIEGCQTEISRDAQIVVASRDGRGRPVVQAKVNQFRRVSGIPGQTRGQAGASRDTKREVAACQNRCQIVVFVQDDGLVVVLRPV